MTGPTGLPLSPYSARPWTSPIRNFSIIAHIDHGKSTLADRILEITGAVPTEYAGRSARLDGPRARARDHDQGAARCASSTRPPMAQIYHLNLIDTPGHVDFSYEVSRSLAACEGALLVVDAAQGVEAQTRRQHLPGDRERAGSSSRSSTRSTCPAPSRSRSPRRSPTSPAVDPEEALWISAPRRGSGWSRSSRRSSTRIPSPKGEPEAPLRGADLRLRVRPVPRRDRLRADGRRLASEARARSWLMQNGTEAARSTDIGFFTAER